MGDRGANGSLIRGWGTVLLVSGPLLALSGRMTPEPFFVVVGGLFTALWGLMLFSLGKRRFTSIEIHAVLARLARNDDPAIPRIVSAFDTHRDARAIVGWLHALVSLQRGDLSESLRHLEAAQRNVGLIDAGARLRFQAELASLRALVRAFRGESVEEQIAAIPAGDSIARARGVLAQAILAYRQAEDDALDAASRELRTLEGALLPLERALLEEVRLRALTRGPYRTPPSEDDRPAWVTRIFDGTTVPAQPALEPARTSLAERTGKKALALVVFLVVAVRFTHDSIDTALTFTLLMFAGAMATLLLVARAETRARTAFVAGRMESLRVVYPAEGGAEVLVQHAFDEEARGAFAGAFKAADRAIYLLDRAPGPARDANVSRVMVLRACLLASLGNADEARTELAHWLKRFPSEVTGPARAQVALRLALAKRDHAAALTVLGALPALSDRERALRDLLRDEIELPPGHEAWIVAVAPGVRVVGHGSDEEEEAEEGQPARMQR